MLVSAVVAAELPAADTAARSGHSWPVTDDLVSCDISDTFSDGVHRHTHRHYK